LRALAVVGLIGAVAGPGAVWAQVPASEVELLRQEIRRLQERLNRLEQRQTAPAPTPAPGPAPAPPVAARPGEREISLDRENVLEVIGLPKPELAGAKFSGFFIGSFNYRSGIQMVPEWAGGASAPADPGHTNFRFDKFGFGVTKSFASWLSAGAAIEVESHADRHTHITTNGTAGCPTGETCERFGAETPSTEVNLDKFDVTVTVPWGNGLRLALGRFDVPFGIERHDENLLLTATTSEIFRFARPQKMTGVQASYAFAPWLDVAAWFVNRWESETTHDPFDDNNRGKSVGGRIGFTPFPTERILNFGIGGWYGSERTVSEDRHRKRWIVDADVTWSPLPSLLLAAEGVYGEEDGVRGIRAVGSPIRAGAITDRDANWYGFYLIGSYDVTRWAGLTVRYGFLNDADQTRTGIDQTLQSITIVPTLHLSALIPDLKPMGVVVPRTNRPFHWVDLKLEYRYNTSDQEAFGEARANHSLVGNSSDHSHEITVQAVVNF
jgi:hypothetical protein